MMELQFAITISSLKLLQVRKKFLVYLLLELIFRILFTEFVSKNKYVEQRFF